MKSSDDIISAINTKLEQAVETLIPLMAKRVRKTEASLRKRLTKIEFLDEPQINARTLSSDNYNTFEIRIYGGLLIFFANMVPIFISTADIVHDDLIVDKSRVPMKNMVVVAQRLIRAFWAGTVEQEFHNTFNFLVHVSDRRMSVADFIVFIIICFTVAHECGHVVIKNWPHVARNELEYSSSYLHQNRKLLLSKPGPHANTSIDNIQDIPAEWHKEIASDIVGLQLCLDIVDDLNTKDLIFSCVELGLILINMLEKYHEKNHGQRLYTVSHPPTEYRVKSLRSAVQSLNLPHVQQTSKAFERLADRIMATM